MNKVILIGRITRDPELRHTQSGIAVCQITVAINRRVSSQSGGPDADFIQVAVWDKQAENVSKYLRKGSQVAVEGRIQTRNYDNNEGKKVYVTEVVATSVQFLDSKSSNTTSETIQNEPSPFDFEPSNNSKSVEPALGGNDPFASFGEKIGVSDNDLPF